jgi:threonine dehydrogenase-like Zn-dependent dehydrogenase
MGHEAIGVVESVGSAVERIAPGDRVVVAFDIACGTCWFCRRGESALCEDVRMMGGGPFLGSLPGTQAERARVPLADVNLLRVPDGVEDERALFVGDALTTGSYAAAIAGISPGDVVAILGAGPVGFFCAHAAAARGATTFAIDPDPSRLALLERTGVPTIDPGARHPEMVLAEATEGRGADVVIDAVGSPRAFASALALPRRGGTVLVVGVYAGETVELQLGVVWARALTLRFTGLCPVHAWWERAMGEVVAGSIDPLPVISHRLSLEEAPLGYDLFDRREAMKVVLTP